MRCKNCGTELSEEFEFCPNCGMACSKLVEDTQDKLAGQNIRNKRSGEPREVKHISGHYGPITTSYVKREERTSRDLLVTIIDGYSAPQSISLADFGKQEIYFGRDPENDIVLTSNKVSAKHGKFVLENGAWLIEDRAVYERTGSTNGILYNDEKTIRRTIHDGDFARISGEQDRELNSVLFLFSTSNSNRRWLPFPLAEHAHVTIGREESCDICLPHISVSTCHAKISREKDGYYITDCNSANGVILNNRRISDKEKLQEKDIITITNTKLIFMTTILFYCCPRDGISVDVSNVTVRRGKGKKSILTNRDVSFSVNPGELVAIVGGSGAGKSTTLNCMCGYLKPAKGTVLINGLDLYQNFDSLKKIIGYVPQSDIVYDNLTLYDMLSYTARLRFPRDSSHREQEEAINKAIDMVELREKRNSLIKALSGGQRKRASIAVELVSNPNLLLLDEPASGLDPGTERNLMLSLRRMADRGKTVVLVTHSTLQLKMCDKIAFMGSGGYLCYFGTYDEALSFFRVSDIVDVYALLTDHAEQWSVKFARTRAHIKRNTETPGTDKVRQKHGKSQLRVLCLRYSKLILNDTQRLLLLLVQAPLLAALISLVADGNQFEQYEMTKSLLFALSCAAFWVGMLNAIQEICKERTIVKREYMTGLSMSAYILSKIMVLGLLCLVQSVLISTVFAWIVGLPADGVLSHPLLELLITTFLMTMAAAAVGLFVSALFTNADRAMTLAPVLLMPQILFSGLIFKLEGVTELISWAAVSRWSVEGYGTIANLNDLPLRLQQQGIMIPHEAELFFEYSAEHLLQSWGILVVYAIAFLILARMALSRIGGEKR